MQKYEIFCLKRSLPFKNGDVAFCCRSISSAASNHIRPAALNRKASIALNLPDGQSKGGSEVLVEFDEIPGPPDGGWGWVICFACFLGMLSTVYHAASPETFFNKVFYYIVLLGNFTGDGIAYTFGVLIKPLSEVRKINISYSDYSLTWLVHLKFPFLFCVHVHT